MSFNSHKSLDEFQNPSKPDKSCVSSYPGQPILQGPHSPSLNFCPTSFTIFIHLLTSKTMGFIRSLINVTALGGAGSLAGWTVWTRNSKFVPLAATDPIFSNAAYAKNENPKLEDASNQKQSAKPTKKPLEMPPSPPPFSQQGLRPRTRDWP